MSDYLVDSGTLFDGGKPAWLSSTPSAISTEGASLAESITRKASTQTYFTIRLLADRPLVDNAYRAYAYFRWVDDTLDQDLMAKEDRFAFLERQKLIIGRCYRGEQPGDLRSEEQIVADLIAADPDSNSGLHTYISQMMAVMAFDAGRKGRLISQLELDIYTLRLSMAVTEALHYFIGHDCAAPLGAARYHAVTAAHITHMLRDAVEDADNGYYNIPRDYLEAHDITPYDLHRAAYPDWVESRTKLARRLFAGGRANLAQVENLRCRLAGYAYIARFEVVLEAIERDGYRLRADYPERKSKRAALRVGTGAISQAFRLSPGNPSGPTISPNAVERIA